MTNPVAAGRRLAQRAALFQGVAVLATVLAFSFLSGRAALAALLGGGALVAGAALAAWRSLGGGVAPAGAVMARMFVGLALKWLLVFAALLAGLVAWRLPALPLLAGVVVALVAQFVAAAVPPAPPR